MKQETLNGHVLGWLLSPKENVEDVAVMLEDTGEVFELSVPFKSNPKEDYYARWFELDGARIYVNGEEIKAEPVPKVLCVRQNNKSYVLIGCRTNGYQRSGEWGTGIIWPNFIVNGARNVDYETISSMRSSISGFSERSGLHSVYQNVHTDDDGLMQEMDIKLKSPDSVSLINDGINVSIYPSWQED